MPQLQNLILKDAAATPVNHTFVPKDIQGGVGMVKESTGVPAGDARFSISCKQNGNGDYRAQLTLTRPVVVTDVGTGAVTVARQASFNGTFTFPASSTEQERKDIVAMVSDALTPSKVLVNDALVKLEGVY